MRCPIFRIYDNLTIEFAIYDFVHPGNPNRMQGSKFTLLNKCPAIAPDKRAINIALFSFFSLLTHMLWVLIRSAPQSKGESRLITKTCLYTFAFP